jgi:hypothetical protein
VAPPRVHSECGRLANLLNTNASAALPSGDVLTKLRNDLQLAADAGGVAGLPAKLLRSAPLVFWHDERPAILIPGLLREFLAATEQDGQPRPRWLRTLIEAWLHDFALGLVAHAEVGRAISTLLARGSAHPTLVQWRRADERYAMFDAARGPERVGRALLEGHDPIADVLLETGMDDPLRAEGGFFRASMVRLVESLPRVMQTGSASVAWQRAAALLEVTQTVRDRHGRIAEKAALRFPDMAASIIQAALAPWLSGNPGAAPRDAVKAFLVRNIGDPRLVPQRWSGASEAAIALVRSWLAADSLEAFLSLISQTNDDQQWRYRQAFWRACLRRIPNAEVWVVLGAALAERAEAIRDLHGSFGRLDEPNDQAVLLIRMGDLVMSEWSNVGPVRAWAVGETNCPRLYRGTYRRDRRRGDDIDGLREHGLNFPDHPATGNGGSHDGKGLWHRQPEKGLWQGCAAALLRNRLRVSLTPADYMPGSR